MAISLGLLAVGVWKEPDCAADDLAGAELQKEEESDQRADYPRSVTCNANCQVRFGAEQPESEDAQGPPGGVPKAANGDTLPPVEERDLCQQARMAWWTRIIAYFTALGAGLLFWTLWETRRDIEQSRRIGEDQMAGYLAATRARVTKDGNRWLFDVVIKNTGQTPSYTIEIEANWMFMWDETHPLPLGADPVERIIKTDTTVDTLNAIFAGQKDMSAHDLLEPSEINEAFMANKLCVMIVGTINYEDTFENDRTEVFEFRRDNITFAEVTQDDGVLLIPGRMQWKKLDGDLWGKAQGYNRKRKSSA